MTDDSISRKAAIDALSYCQTYLFDSRDDDKKISLEDAEYAIEQLPSAQPERKKGKWIDNNNIWMCNKCGKWIDILQGDADMNFCPNCGADMREREGAQDG